MGDSRNRGGRRSAALAAVAFGTIVAAGAPALTAPAMHRVHLLDGRSLDVAGYTVRRGQAILTTPEGHVLGFTVARVARVEPLPAEGSRDARAGLQVPPPAPAVQPQGGPAPSYTPGPESIEALIQDAALKYDLEVELLTAVIAVESGYRPDAVSPRGAQGLMQLMPRTAKDLAVSDPFDPAQNVDAGARHLRKLIDQNDGQYWRALAAYNAGPRPVARYDGLPPYSETISYVKRVLSRYQSSVKGPSAAPTAMRGKR